MACSFVILEMVQFCDALYGGVGEGCEEWWIGFCWQDRLPLWVGCFWWLWCWCFWTPTADSVGIDASTQTACCTSKSDGPSNVWLSRYGKPHVLQLICTIHVILLDFRTFASSLYHMLLVWSAKYHIYNCCSQSTVTFVVFVQINLCYQGCTSPMPTCRPSARIEQIDAWVLAHMYGNQVYWKFLDC